MIARTTSGDPTSRDALYAPRVARYPKPAADAAASTATAETAFFAMSPATRTQVAFSPSLLVIEAVDFLPSAALTADATNNATLTVRRRNADGSGAATVASITTNIASGNWTAFVSKALTLGAALTLEAQQILTLQITKAGSGVAVPAGVLRVTYRPE